VLDTSVIQRGKLLRIHRFGGGSAQAGHDRSGRSVPWAGGSQ